MCANQTNFAPRGPSRTANVWTGSSISLGANQAPISAITSVNFRVHFLPRTGGPGGNLSPDDGRFRPMRPRPDHDAVVDPRPQLRHPVWRGARAYRDDVARCGSRAGRSQAASAEGLGD